METECLHCGDLAVDEDGTCRSCGIVTEDIKFGSDSYNTTSYVYPNYVPSQNKLRSKSSYKPPTLGLSYGLSVLKNLCHLYNISSERQAEITCLMKEAYNARAYREKEDVGVLSGCLLLLVLRKYDQFISIKDLRSKMKCSKKQFCRIFKFARSFCCKDKVKNLSESEDSPESKHVLESENVPDVGSVSKFKHTSKDRNIPESQIISKGENIPTSQVPEGRNVSEAPSLSESDEDITFLENQKEENTDNELHESVVAQIPLVLAHAPDDERSVLSEKSKQLLKLANSCWLLTGRCPRSVTIACAFLCWKSMHPSRKKAPFTRFCAEYRLKDRQAYLRIPELLSMLLKLGSKIPSYAENYVNKQNVLFHLNYILENSVTLRNDLLEEENSDEAINCKEYSSFRRERKRLKPSEDDCCASYNPDMQGSDVEISDSEIMSYIRTDEQRKFIEKIKAKLENNEISESHIRLKRNNK